MLIPKEYSSHYQTVSNSLSDPISFANHFGKIEPYPYQKDFLTDTHQNQIFKTGRQVGKTTCASLKALWLTLTTPNFVVLIVSATQRQSSIMFWKIRETIAPSRFLKAKLERETLTSLFWENGSKIHSLPAGRTGETIRGYTANVVLVDEASHVPDEVFTAIVPSLATTQGSLILLSTPFGKSGQFWNAWNSPLFSKHQAKSVDNPLVTKEFLSDQATQMTEMEYRQEFGGEFVESTDNFFETVLITACTFDPFELKDYQVKTEGVEYYLGVDVARFGLDETVYIVTEFDGDKYRVVEIQATSKKPATDVMGRIKVLHEKYNFNQVFIDESSFGGAVLDEVKETYADVRGVPFSLQSKADLFKNLKLLMEQGRVSYPQNSKLLSQMAALEYEFTSGGLLKIHHPDKPNAHDDYVDSLALSVYAEISGGRGGPLPAISLR